MILCPNFAYTFSQDLKIPLNSSDVHSVLWHFLDEETGGLLIRFQNCCVIKNRSVSFPTSQHFSPALCYTAKGFASLFCFQKERETGKTFHTWPRYTPLQRTGKYLLTALTF